MIFDCIFALVFGFASGCIIGRMLKDLHNYCAAELTKDDIEESPFAADSYTDKFEYHIDLKQNDYWFKSVNAGGDELKYDLFICNKKTGKTFVFLCKDYDQLSLIETDNHELIFTAFKRFK